MFKDDKAIKQAQEDRLNRSDIANKFATYLRNYSNEESFVIGIQGRWGDGKTSFINLIKSHLQSNQIPEENEYIIIDFNPWYFSGDNQILKQFCNTF